MAVALDVAGTKKSEAAKTSTAYTGITVGGGSLRAIVLSMSWLADPGTISVINWDNLGTPQPLTLIQSIATSNGQVCKLYGLVAPTPGNKTLQVTWANSTEYGMNVAAWTGVDQTGGATSFPNSGTATGTSAAATVTITLPSNGAGVSCVACGSFAALNSVSATQLWLQSGAGFWEAGGSYSTSSGTFTGTLGGSDGWAIAATGIAADTGGGGSTSGGPCLDGRTFRGLTNGRVLSAPMSREARMMAEADRLWRQDRELRRAA